MDFGKFRNVVIKVGTAALMDGTELNRELMTDLVAGICDLRAGGVSVVLVSSGAIGLGRQKIGLNATELPVDLQQATAAIGQPSLMNEYEKRFELHGVNVAQLLLTGENLASEASFSNIRNMLNRLLELGVVPIINENDSVSVAELSHKGVFSDNDTLASLITEKLGFGLLVMLTNVDGLYDSSPSIGNAVLIPEVSDIDSVAHLVSAHGSCPGRGGMETKLEAAKRVVGADGCVVITKLKKSVLQDLARNRLLGTVLNPKD